jgi:hypothetical protein
MNKNEILKTASSNGWVVLTKSSTDDYRQAINELVALELLYNLSTATYRLSSEGHRACEIGFEKWYIEKYTKEPWYKRDFRKIVIGSIIAIIGAIATLIITY